MLVIGNDRSEMLRLAAVTGSPVLNLSKEILPCRMLDIGADIRRHAESVKELFLASFDGIRPDPEEYPTYILTPFHWKSFYSSTLFLDLIHYRIFEEQRDRHEHLLVYVHSPPLFRFLRERRGTWRHPGRLVVRRHFLANLKRRFVPWRFLASAVLSALRYGRSEPRAKAPAEVLVYSYAQPSCFVGEDGWRDPFLGDLCEDLERIFPGGVRRFAPLGPSGLERAMRRRAGYLVPAIGYLRPVDLIRLSCWRPRLPRTLGGLRVQVGGADVSSLYRHHLRQDLASGELHARRLFAVLIGRMLDDLRPQLVVYPHENQPWEKQLNLEAHRRGIRCLAVQHASLSSWMFNYGFCASDDPSARPDLLACTGTWYHGVLDRLHRGYGPRMCVAGSKRHVHPPRLRRKERVDHVLVAFSGDQDSARDLLDTLNARAGDLTRFTFHLKPYPGRSLPKVDLRFRHVLETGSLDEALEGCGTVIAENTTVGIEAYVRNRNVLRPLPSHQYDQDMTEGLGDRVPAADRAGLPELLRRSLADTDDNPPVKADLFFFPWTAETTRSLWEQILRPEAGPA